MRSARSSGLTAAVRRSGAKLFLVPEGLPEEELTSVDLTVEDAFKLVMSAGLVAPEMRRTEKPALGIDPATIPVLGLEALRINPSSAAT